MCAIEKSGLLDESVCVSSPDIQDIFVFQIPVLQVSSCYKINQYLLMIPAISKNRYQPFSTCLMKKEPIMRKKASGYQEKCMIHGSD